MLVQLLNFPSNSTSQGSALSVAFLQTPDLVAGVPTEVEAGGGANSFLQDPATTRVRHFILFRCRLELDATLRKSTKK